MRLRAGGRFAQTGVACLSRFGTIRHTQPRSRPGVLRGLPTRYGGPDVRNRAWNRDKEGTGT